MSSQAPIQAPPLEKVFQIVVPESLDDASSILAIESSSMHTIFLSDSSRCVDGTTRPPLLTDTALPENGLSTDNKRPSRPPLASKKSYRSLLRDVGRRRNWNRNATKMLLRCAYCDRQRDIRRLRAENERLRTAGLSLLPVPKRSQHPCKRISAQQAAETGSTQCLDIRAYNTKGKLAASAVLAAVNPPKAGERARYVIGFCIG